MPVKDSGSQCAAVVTQSGVSTEQVYLTRGLPNGFGSAPLVDDYLYGTEPGGQLLAEFTTGKAMWKAESVGSASVAYEMGFLCSRL